MSEINESVIEIAGVTKEQLEGEYSRCAELAGDKQFKVKVYEAEIALLCEKMLQVSRQLAEMKDIDIS